MDNRFIIRGSELISDTIRQFPVIKFLYPIQESYLDMVRMFLIAIALLMLGIASVLATGADTASADGRDLCISVNGDLKVDTVEGEATCISGQSDKGRPNIARAFDGGQARSGTIEGDSGNTATATGDGAWAAAGNGDNNIASATGDGAQVIAGSGDNNNVTATGDGALARAAIGDNNIVTATGDGAYADVLYGSNNRVTATGNCSAIISGVDNQTVNCP